jgi:pimeloyl-ACP methyl ester carboxylesterase
MLGRLAIDLSGDFRVSEPLQRRGGSVPLTVDLHVTDLAAVLEGPTRVVGHSWGAMLGLNLAAAHPELVERLALVGCGTYDRASRAEHDRLMAQRLGAEGRARKEQLKAAAFGATADERDLLLAERGRQSAIAQSYELLPDALDPAPTDLPLDAKGHDETWDDAMRRQHEHVDPESFTSVRCPVLMLHGDTDPHPGASTFDTLHDYIPQLTYEELERCGHSPWLEVHAREPFLRALTEWLW